MKHLHLTCELFTEDMAEYRELETKLHLFPALQQNELFVEEWFTENDIVIPPQNTITLNTTITRLRIKTARTTPETMQYFAINFNALKDLDAKFRRRIDSVEQDDEWWRHLTCISLGLTRYTFGIRLSVLGEESGVVELN